MQNKEQEAGLKSDCMVKRMAGFGVHVYLILNIFICKGVTLVAEIDCNFDINFCDWQQDVVDDFNWTKGINYIYADANNNYKDRIARLISSMQPPGYYCLTLLYSIPVRYSGTLNVYTQMNGGDKTIIFSKDKGIDDAYWWKSVLNIEAFDSYQIVFEGIVWDRYRGDIKIFNISMRSGSCSDCDFDDDFCNWMQFDGDDFNWDRGPYNYIGPDVDKTSGSKPSH